MPDSDLPALSAEAAKEVAARTIYTTDGLWFLAVEEAYGFDAAFELNQRVWKRGGIIYARRLVKNLNLDGKPPMEALAIMLRADPVMAVRRTAVTSQTDTRLAFRTYACPPAEARLRDGRGVFNGVPGCFLLFQAYATVIDPRIRANCIACVPNPGSPEYWCEWEFTISQDK